MEKELIDRLEVEHELFYCRTIAQPPEQVYDQCNIIRFHECIYEYFLYCEEINKEHIGACLREREIFAALHGIYLEYESLDVSTWEQIGELLNMLVSLQKI